jgi:hypothetical protein
LLSYFRVNAPYQYVVLLGLLVLIRLPFLLSPLPLLIPELNWLLVGEQMATGKTLYRDIWDNLSPLAAGTYWVLHLAFGRSVTALHLAAAILTVFQIGYFNYLCSARGVFVERNFWPGLFYALFLNMSFDCSTLSPVLLSTTFLLPALNILLRQLERQGATDDVFELGVYLGLSALCYLPSALFVAWAVLSLVLYSGASLRQHVLLLLGFFVPVLLTMLYYYFADGLDELNRNLLTSVFRVQRFGRSDFGNVAIALLVPLVLGGLGVVSLFGAQGRYVNFQQRTQQIILLWLLTALLTVGLMPYLAPMLFVSLVPPMAFFAVLYFQTVRRAWQAELGFLVAVGLVVGVLYQSIWQIVPGVDAGRLRSLRVGPSPEIGLLRNKKLLVFGDDLNAYQYNRPATPYVNWQLARYDLEHLDNYEAVVNVYDHIRRDPPDYILDRQRVMPTLLQRAPALGSQYRLTSRANLYRRTKPG